MTNLRKEAYMKIDMILTEKKKLSMQLCDKVKALKLDLPAETCLKLDEVLSMFKVMSSSDTQIKEVLDAECHRKIPALYRKKIC